MHKGRQHRGGRGVGPKADIVREVACIYYYRSIQNSGKGGSKNPKILPMSFMYPKECLRNVNPRVGATLRIRGYVAVSTNMSIRHMLLSDTLHALFFVPCVLLPLQASCGEITKGSLSCSFSERGGDPSFTLRLSTRPFED